MALSIVSSVAQYLGGLVVHEKELLGGVADQIENIQVEMKQMQCFLKDADERVNESENIHNLVADIRDLAYNAEDIIESYILKAKYASFFNPKRYIRLHVIGKEIKTLQLKIQHFTRRVETYGFLSTGQEGGTSSTTEMQRQLRQSYPHYDDEDVIGIQDNIKVLVAELIKKEGPHLVSIVGMGGLGKTTLAKKVYNHDAVKRYFDCCAWSYISKQFQGRTILQEIIRKVCNETEHENLNDGEMKEKLYKLLEDKCYLVILDDIWSTEAWDVLKPAFPKGKMGSKIMLSTRIKDVVFYADPLGFIFEPACLTEEQSWELFCKKDFLWKNVASSSSTLYHPEAEKKKKLGRDMIKKCGGLPLAVVVLRGLLGTKKSIHEWEMVAKDITKYLNRVEQRQEQHGVLGILSLSYHDLPSYIKPCFLYLGLYLEDSEIHKKVLIQMWIAEGFLQQYNGLETMSKEEIGEKYLLQLINRSMVQLDEMSFHGKLKTCRLHDLMRDLCLKKAKQENFLSTFDGESAASDSSSSTSEVASIFNHPIHRHAIYFTCDRYVSMQQSIRSPHLRAFFFWGSSNLDVSTMLKFVFKKFNFLRVLELWVVKIDSLPRAIGNLIHLRYLNVNGYHEIKVPSTIGNLRSLQFLKFYEIERLPNVLWKMERLNFWSFHCGLTHDNKPLQVDGLKNLSTLELVWGKDLLLEFARAKLTNLRTLAIEKIEGGEWKSLRMSPISRLDRLQFLKLTFESDDIISGEYDWSPLSHCPSLWKLQLTGKLRKLPQLQEFPPNLKRLKLNPSFLEVDPIPTLKSLPYLESLTLTTEYFGKPFYDFNRILPKYYFTVNGFPRLQYLRFHWLRTLEELEVEKGALPYLVNLEINGCNKLRMLPQGLRFITGLEKLGLIGMPDEFNRRLREDGNHDWHKIQHIPSIIIRRH